MEKINIKKTLKNLTQQDKKKIPIIVGIILLWIAFLTIITLALILKTTEQEESKINLETISERYWLKEGKENINGFTSEKVTDKYISKEDASTFFEVKTNKEQVEGVTSDRAIDPNLISQNYLLKFGETNLNNVISEKANDNYVLKSTVVSNYRLAHYGVEYEGITTTKALNPSDVTNKYLLREGETNLPGVNAPLVTVSYVNKELIKSKYKAKIGHVQEEGINADFLIPEYSFIYNRQLIKEVGQTGKVAYAIVPINYQSEATTKDNRGIYQQLEAKRPWQQFFFHLTKEKTVYGSYFTHSRDSDERVSAFRLEVNVKKTYFFVASTVYYIFNNNEAEPEALLFEVEMLLNENGTITYTLTPQSGPELARRSLNNPTAEKRKNLKPSDFPNSFTGRVGIIFSNANTDLPNFQIFMNKITGTPHIGRINHV